MKTYKEKLTELYLMYNPSSVGDVDKLLAKYKGYEEILLERFYRKYKVGASGRQTDMRALITTFLSNDGPMTKGISSQEEYESAYNHYFGVNTTNRRWRNIGLFAVVLLFAVLLIIWLFTSEKSRMGTPTSSADSGDAEVRSLSKVDSKKTSHSPCDKFYVGIWESENITSEDGLKIKNPKAKTYLRITKPDDFFRVELKAKKEDEYSQLGNLFHTLFGRCGAIFQVEKPIELKNNLFYDEETNKLELQSTPYSLGFPEKGVMRVTYHRFK